MPSPRKRSVRIAGHPTSVSVEDAFWGALADIAAGRGIAVARLIDEIDGARGEAGLSSAVRLHVLDWYRRRAGEGPERGAYPAPPRGRGGGSAS